MSRDIIEVDEYAADETWEEPENNQLLDDAGEPNPDITNPRHMALATLAAAVHRHARMLTSSQTEQVIRWLKRWKRGVRGTNRSHGADDAEFLRVMNGLKDSPEQKALQRRAYWKTVWARFWSVLFAVAAAVTLGLFIEDGVAWYWRVIAVIVSWFLLIASDGMVVAAVETYKEQDRRYLLRCIREAETVSELNGAGVFAFIPEATVEIGKPFDLAASRAAMRREQERLSDALYADPDMYLAPSALDSMK